MLDNNTAIGAIIGTIVTVIFFYFSFRARQPKIRISGCTRGSDFLGLNFYSDPSSFGMKLERESCTINSVLLTDTKNNERYSITQCWTDNSDSFSRADLEKVTISVGGSVSLAIFRVSEDAESYSVIDNQKYAYHKTSKKYNSRKTKFRLDLIDTLGRKHSFYFLIIFSSGNIHPNFEFTVRQRFNLIIKGIQMAFEAFRFSRFM